MEAPSSLIDIISVRLRFEAPRWNPLACIDYISKAQQSELSTFDCQCFKTSQILVTSHSSESFVYGWEKSALKIVWNLATQIILTFIPRRIKLNIKNSSLICASVIPREENLFDMALVWFSRHDQTEMWKVWKVLSCRGFAEILACRRLSLLTIWFIRNEMKSFLECVVISNICQKTCVFFKDTRQDKH